MLHDIGKSQIPLAILEKPGPLDENEMAVMRKHPEYGLDALRTTSDLPAEMLDMVVHHHELLDGSGYPHGLHGSEVSDLVRIMTISDIFGALLERRSYKEPLSGDAAYQILLDMGRNWTGTWFGRSNLPPPWINAAQPRWRLAFAGDYPSRFLSPAA